MSGPACDLARLRARLAGPLDCQPGDLTAELIDGGRSNLTYQLRAGQRRWVLRRPRSGMSSRPPTTWPASTG